MTTAFPDELLLKHLDPEKYGLLAPYRFVGGGRTITVPQGVVTDFASVPRIFWSLVPPDGDYTGSAVIHDYLYATRGLGGELTRADCDGVFLEAMTAAGVGWFTRSLLFRTVRLFGGAYWNNGSR